MKSRTGFEPMRAREPLRVMPTIEFEATTPLPGEANKTQVHAPSKRKTRGRTIWQFVRFGLVGCLYHMGREKMPVDGTYWSKAPKKQILPWAAGHAPLLLHSVTTEDRPHSAKLCARFTPSRSSNRNRGTVSTPYPPDVAGYPHVSPPSCLPSGG